MTKHVYSSHYSLCHAWAAQAVDHGRASRMFFEGPTIYSYGKHFPIATIVKRTSGNPSGTAGALTEHKLVLFNEEKYSPSTGGHQSCARQAVSHLTQVEVPQHVLDSPSDPLNHQWVLNKAQDKIAAALAENKRAISGGTWPLSRARAQAENYAAYATFYGLAQGALLPEDFDTMVTAAQVKRAAWDTKRLERDSARYAKQREREARQREIDKLEYAEKRELWLKGEGVNLSYHNNWDVLTETLLRVKGKRIQTSRGAEVTIDDGKRLWEVVQRVMRRKALWIQGRGDEALKLGPYDVDAIKETGDVTIGCHDIKYSELRRIAVELGLEEKAA